MTTTISAARLDVRALAIAAAAALMPACGAPPLVLPQPPQDLTALAQAYASPSGTVDTAHLQQVVTDAEARLHGSDLDWLPVLVSRALVRVRLRFDDNGLPSDPTQTLRKNRPAMQAVVNVQHICQGWTAPPGPPDQAANGRLDLTAVVDDSQLQSGVWGDSTSCQEQVQALDLVSVNAFVSGSVGVLLEGPLPENDEQARALVQVSGQIGTDGHVANGSFDFVIVGAAVGFRYPVSDGDLIVLVGPESVSVHGSNGAFTCDLSGVTCAPS
jgi:hypothetical protein